MRDGSNSCPVSMPPLAQTLSDEEVAKALGEFGKNNYEWNLQLRSDCEDQDGFIMVVRTESLPCYFFPQTLLHT